MSMQISSIEGFQISPQQKHLWLLQEGGDKQSYRVQCAVLVEGDINHQVLQQAIQKVIERHEILRTSFQTLKDMSIPLQVINYKNPLSIEYRNLNNVDLEKQEIYIENLYQQQRQFSFDWQKGSVLNINLVSISPRQSMLPIAISALCADRVTIHNFVREISVAYTACLSQTEISDEPLQYADIAAWQNELFAGEDAEAAKEYWYKQNMAQRVVSPLPIEKQTLDKAVFQPKFISIHLHPEILTNIRLLASTNAVSVSTILMACWQVLLWRLTGKFEMVVATCFDGRNYEELKPALGLLAKYIPVPGHLEEESKFSEIVKQLDITIKEVERWQESFIWEEMFSGDRNRQNLSFFPFAFEFNSQPTQFLAGNVSFSIYKQYVCIDRFKVKLSCLQQDDSLTAEFHYDAHLFDEGDIQRLAAQFQTLLASAIHNPQTAIAQLEILSHEERQKLLVEFNNTKIDPAPYQCIHHWIEAQANNTPNNVAVVFEDQQLTYQELNTKADNIAHQLAGLGVQPEIIVALYIERSLDIAVGILGILKAGGAYLPLDSSMPAEALAFRLEDAQAGVLLTQKHLVDQLPLMEKSGVQVVCIGTDRGEPISKDIELSTATSENLAYIIYTSGSTGKPKGVTIEHRQLLNYLNGILEKLDLPIGASFATVSTFAADLGNTAIFSALCTGGCLHIISQERATDPVALADYCRHYQIDCLKIVPSHLSALLTSRDAAQFLPRQRLILGGEACSWELIKQVHKLAPDCQIVNHYGPTETTVGVLAYTVDLASVLTDTKSEKVPLGRPLANTQIYLLDNYQQPVPLGVPGEIYIGGESVARGYLNQAEMTAERFIRNPFSTASETRLYKTGDLACYRPDGNLEFLGRVDDQVKLHGFRIELGEIETVLSQHPQVREAVVLARENDLGDKHLVAYIVSNVETKNSASLQNPKSSDLRNYLKQKLPEYMVPSHFVELKALPLTPNGKVDRKGLPAPDSVKPELQGTFVAPRTPVEVALADIWSEILGLKQVGIYDNFFELGGDSIISIQVIAKANQMGLRLTPKQIFDHQTIAKLATIADTAPEIKSEQGLVTGSVPLTPVQCRFFNQNLPEPHYWNQSLLLELQQELDPKLVYKAVQYLLEHHDALRLRFQQQADNWQAVNTGLGKEVPFTRLDFSTLPQENQKAAIEETSAQLQASLNLSDGSLMRVVLFDLGRQQPSRLLIIIHHLVVDGVSWRILLSDLQTALEQLSRGEAIQLPAKTTSFKQWAEHLREYAQTKALNLQLDYWCSEQRKRVARLPLDYPDGVNTISQARTVSVFLTEAETQVLLQEVPTAYHTQVNDVLLTALVQAFAKWTGQRVLLVNLEGHGREDIFADVDLSRTVGWFTTVFPVLLDLEDASTLEDALKTIKEQLRSIPNRGMDYGVVRYLSSDRTIAQSLAAMPQPQVCFNYLGQFDPVLQEPSLFRFASESSGLARSSLGNRCHLIDINGFVTKRHLQMDWTYNRLIHKESTVSSLAKKFITALRDIITHCQSPEAFGYTPSDFPKAHLNQKDLDQLLARINRK